MSNATYWLIASAILLGLEAFGIPGIGFLFAGIAAFTTALLIELGLLSADALVLQWALFFIVTGLSAALLWRKLKSWRMNPNTPEYSNIVGTEATVAALGLSGKNEGHVNWSGTQMRARLADETAPALTAGATVTITRVEGNVLFVTAK
jgi:membrane protein implicated in regulation of membrane protease activity